MRLALSIYALIVTPLIWWWIARSGAHQVRRAAWAGALVVAALWAMLIGATVFETARHGTGDGGLGGLAVIAAVLVLPVVWGVSILAGAALGALVGVVQGLLPELSPRTHATSPEALPEVQARDSGLTGEKLRSEAIPLARWLDQGNRREQLKVMGPLMALPLAAMLSIGYIAFEWKRTEVHTEDAREISPRSNRVAAAFSHRWQWTRAHNHYDVRVSESGRDPARGLVVWDSSKVPITRLEWTDQDSLLVHVDMHNDEFVPWLTSTIRTHKVRGVPVRTVIKLTPGYLMVTNPRLPDDLQVRPEDIQLSGVPVSVGDSL